MRIESNQAIQLPTMNAMKPNGEKKEEFDKLWSYIGGLNKEQKVSEKTMSDVLMGKSDNTHGALISMQKAELNLQLATTIRDKATEGYKTLINMQI